jgi:hypothetical protein
MINQASGIRHQALGKTVLFVISRREATRQSNPIEKLYKSIFENSLYNVILSISEESKSDLSTKLQADKKFLGCGV